MNLIVQLGLIFLIYQWAKKAIDGRLFIIAVLIKVSAGMLLGLLFFKHYQGGDTVDYYQSALNLSFEKWNHFWHEIFEPTISSDPVRAIYFTRILAVLLFFTHGDYWLASVYYSIFSLFGAIYFIYQLSHWKKSYLWPAIIAFLFLPSVVMWSAGIIKESIAFAAMLLIVGAYVKYKMRERIGFSDFFLLGWGILILALLKYYVLGVLLPVLTFLVIYDQLGKRDLLFKGIWRNVLFLLPLLVLPTYYFLYWLHPNFDIAYFGEIIQAAHVEMIANSKSINGIPALDWLDNHLLNVAVNTIYYLFSGLFRPLFLENLCFPGIFSSLENLILFILFLWKMATLKKSNVLTIEAFALLGYVAILALFLTYSLPNLGALARFKVYYLPFFVLFILVDHPLIKRVS